MKRIFLLTAIICAVSASTALASSHLYLSEANAFYHDWVRGLNGVITTHPCQRVNDHTAVCAAEAHRKLEGTECHFRLTVSKSYRNHRYFWHSKLWHNCVYVGHG